MAWLSFFKNAGKRHKCSYFEKSQIRRKWNMPHKAAKAAAKSTAKSRPGAARKHACSFVASA